MGEGGVRGERGGGRWGSPPLTPSVLDPPAIEKKLKIGLSASKKKEVN